MRKNQFLYLVIGLCALPLLGANCGLGPTGDDAGGASDHALPQDATGQDTAAVPSGHTENLNGTWHLPGKENPLANCVSCHGNDLSGGSGPSCYGCHNSNDHTTSYRGVMHRSGTSSSCSVCHGPSNSGGLGPACRSCH